MTCKSSQSIWEDSIEEQLHGFEALKLRLIIPPLIALSKAGKPYIIGTDASAYQLEVIPLQLQEDESRRPVGYCSYTLNNAEKNNVVMEREFYDIAWVV